VRTLRNFIARIPAHSPTDGTRPGATTGTTRQESNATNIKAFAATGIGARRAAAAPSFILSRSPSIGISVRSGDFRDDGPRS